MVSLAFVISFVVSAVAMLIGIVIFTEVEDGMIGTFGAPVLIQNGTAGGINTTNIMYECDSPFAGTQGENKIHRIDKTTGDIISNSTMVISGLPDTLFGCLGMAVDPTSGDFYIIANYDGAGINRYLAVVDPVTGIGSAIGNMGEKFGTLAFNSDGELRAMGGASSDIESEYFSIDKTTGTPTQLCEFIHSPPTSFMYQYLMFNWSDDTMYRFTIDLDQTFGSQTEFKKTDDSCNEVIIGHVTGDGMQPSEPDPAQEGANGAFDTVDGVFYFVGKNNRIDFEPSLLTITTSGVQTFVDEDHCGNILPDCNTGEYDVKGLAFTLTTGVGSPPIFEGGVPDSFASASSIGLTVLGVLPIALFFALFTILSGRVDGGE